MLAIGSIVFLATTVSADVTCGDGTVYVARAAIPRGRGLGQPIAGVCMSIFLVSVI